MSLYCDGNCEHLDAKKHRCIKWNQKVTYVKHTGFLGYTVHETCDECRNTEGEESDQ